MRKILFLLFCGLNLAANQIKSIDYDGLIHISKDSATDISGLKIGDEIDDEKINQAVVNLYEQGYFKDIFVQNNGGDVLFVLKEKPIIAKIDVKGVVSNDKKAIDTIIGIKKGQTYDKKGLNLAKERIGQFYQAKSYFDTVVDENTTFLKDSNTSVEVKLNVNRGENIIIKKVNLIGAQAKDYGDFEPFIANKQREFMGWFWGRNDGAVKIYDLPADSDKIRDVYLKYGYLDANVSNPFLNVNFDNYTANLTYFIQEGQKYRAGKVSINAPAWLGLNSDELAADLKLQKGDVMNSEWIKKDIAKLEEIVADKGYAYVSVSPQTIKSGDQIVDVVYKITPGEQVRIRNVVISGNDKTLDRVIRRELYLTEGNLYSKSDLKDSKNALGRTGYFEDVQIVQTRVDNDKIDLEVVLKETNTGSITGGVGYGTSDGILLNLGVSENNVFGSGYRGSINIDKSKNTLSGNIGLTNPRVFDSRYSLGGNIFANDYEWNDYEEKNHGFNVVAGRQIGRYTNTYLTYQLEKTKIKGLNEFYVQAGYLNGQSVKSSLIPSVVYNDTDDYFLPREGFIASTNLELAGLGGDVKFAKNRTSFNWYQGLGDYIDYDLILRYKSSLSYVLDIDKKLPINEKLFLGGIGSIRGFESRSVTPKRNICIHNRCRQIDTGGKIAFNNSAELSFPIITRVKMRGVLFLDYGMIGQSSLSQIKRYSAGVGIEWITPIGPLQLIFAKPLNKQPGDETNTFEFNVGRRF